MEAAETGAELMGAVEIAKDGYWLVPPEKRPRNWQTMGLRERVTVTEQSRTTVTEREVVMAEALPPPPEEPKAVAKWMPPFIDATSPHDAEFMDLCVEYHTGPKRLGTR